MLEMPPIFLRPYSSTSLLVTLRQGFSLDSVTQSSHGSSSDVLQVESLLILRLRLRRLRFVLCKLLHLCVSEDL